MIQVAHSHPVSGLSFNVVHEAECTVGVLCGVFELQLHVGPHTAATHTDRQLRPILLRGWYSHPWQLGTFWLPSSLCQYLYFVHELWYVGTRVGSEFNIQWRSFAKKARDGKRDTSKKGHGHAVKVTLSHEELNTVINYDNMLEQMETTLEHLRKEYAEQLSLRTSLSAFDNLIVDTPDGQFPLIQIAQVNHIVG